MADDHFSPATPECPDVSVCRNCGRPIAWNDYGYIHPGGDADCSRNGRTCAQPIEWEARRG